MRSSIESFALPTEFLGLGRLEGGLLTAIDCSLLLSFSLASLSSCRSIVITGSSESRGMLGLTLVGKLLVSTFPPISCLTSHSPSQFLFVPGNAARVDDFVGGVVPEAICRRILIVTQKRTRDAS